MIWSSRERGVNTDNRRSQACHLFYALSGPFESRGRPLWMNETVDKMQYVFN